MINDWQAFAKERRAKRQFQPARQAKRKNSVASLAKAWHISKEQLEAAIFQIAKEKNT